MSAISTLKGVKWKIECLTAMINTERAKSLLPCRGLSNGEDEFEFDECDYRL